VLRTRPAEGGTATPSPATVSGECPTTRHSTKVAAHGLPSRRPRTPNPHRRSHEHQHPDHQTSHHDRLASARVFASRDVTSTRPHEHHEPATVPGALVTSLCWTPTRRRRLTPLELLTAAPRRLRCHAFTSDQALAPGFTRGYSDEGAAHHAPAATARSHPKRRTRSLPAPALATCCAELPSETSLGATSLRAHERDGSRRGRTPVPRAPSNASPGSHSRAPARLARGRILGFNTRGEAHGALGSPPHRTAPKPLDLTHPLNQFGGPHNDFAFSCGVLRERSDRGHRQLQRAVRRPHRGQPSHQPRVDAPRSTTILRGAERPLA